MKRAAVGAARYVGPLPRLRGTVKRLTNDPDTIATDSGRLLLQVPGAVRIHLSMASPPMRGAYPGIGS